MIRSEDGTANGLAVISANGSSLLEHVVFGNLSSIEKRAWKLTGAVTFYESEVEIRNSTFRGANAEDALNVVRSRFVISDSSFTDSRSDAFDADCSRGEIIDSRFSDCRNDCIDIGDSAVTMKSVHIERAGDKAISIGERSRVDLQRVVIEHANIGVAGKDNSVVNANALTVRNSGIGVTAYQKKAEYGPGFIALEAFTVENTPMPYLVEENSHVLVDGTPVTPQEKDVAAIIDPA